MGTHYPLTRPRARQNDGSLMVNDWLMSHMRASCDVATVHASYARSVSANFAWFLLGWRRIHWAEAPASRLVDEHARLHMLAIRRAEISVPVDYASHQKNIIV